MKFEITGADRESGEDVILTYDATDEKTARAKAARQNVLVATCRPLEAFPAPEATRKPSAASRFAPAIKVSKAVWANRKLRLVSIAVGVSALLLAFFIVNTYRTMTDANAARAEASGKLADAYNKLSEKDKALLEKDKKRVAELEAVLRTLPPVPKAEAAVAGRTSGTKKDAIREDYVISNFVGRYPDMEYILRTSRQRLDLKLTMMVGNGLISLEESRYITNFADRIANLPD